MERVRNIKRAATAALLVGVLGLGGCGEVAPQGVPEGTPVISIRIDTPTAVANTETPTNTPGNNDILPPFPTTADGAASLFGASAVDWQPLFDKSHTLDGWHLQVSSTRREVNPQGYLMEGYFNTQQGKTVCGTSSDQQELQGGTIWNQAATLDNEGALARRMAQPPSGSCSVFPSPDFNG